MRLIDADALIEELHHMIEGDADLRKDYEYMGIDDCIRSMPTAYNVDAVVKQLEEEREYAYADFEEYANRYELDLSDDDDWYHIGLERAIKLVRKGGAE